MAKYDLLLNVTAAAANQAVPQGQRVHPHGPMNPNNPPSQETFQLEVSGVGAVSASVQLLGTNDTDPDPSNWNWTPMGVPLGPYLTASGTNLATAMATLNESFRAYGAVVQAISGTSASVICRMSA